MDPTALITPNSALWKMTKTDIRKQSVTMNNIKTDQPRSFDYKSIDLTRDSYNPYALDRAKATPIPVPMNPPRTIPSSSVHRSTSSRYARPEIAHPDTAYPSQFMSTAQADEALKNLFESALIPEKEGEQEATEEEDETAASVEGLKVTLMKHQIEGLKFLQDHESGQEKDKRKKSKFGGILADDVGPFVSGADRRWVLERQFRHLR